MGGADKIRNTLGLIKREPSQDVLETLTRTFLSSYKSATMIPIIYDVTVSMQQLETIFEQRPDVKEFMATHYSSQELPDGTSTDQYAEMPGMNMG